MAVQNLPVLITNEFFSPDLETEEHRNAFLLTLRDRYLKVAQNLNALSRAIQSYKISVTAATTQVDVNLSPPYPDLNFAPIPVLSWNATAWISVQKTNQVRINFSAAPGSTKNVYLVCVG